MPPASCHQYGFSGLQAVAEVAEEVLALVALGGVELGGAEVEAPGQRSDTVGRVEQSYS